VISMGWPLKMRGKSVSRMWSKEVFSSHSGVIVFVPGMRMQICGCCCCAMLGRGCCKMRLWGGLLKDLKGHFLVGGSSGHERRGEFAFAGEIGPVSSECICKVACIYASREWIAKFV